SPAPAGEGAQRCMRMALRDAKLAPDQISYINAHGTSTKQNDASETRAVKAVFGDHAYKLAISSTKSMTGHTLGAAGGIETAFTALTVQRGILPPTINRDTPDPECDLDVVPNQAREKRVDRALSNSFDFGGTNPPGILGRAPGPSPRAARAAARSSRACATAAGRRAPQIARAREHVKPRDRARARRARPPGRQVLARPRREGARH